MRQKKITCIYKKTDTIRKNGVVKTEYCQTVPRDMTRASVREDYIPDALIEAGVKRIIREYGEVLDRLANE